MARILVIDADATTQTTLQEALQKEGHEVAITGNGVEGIRHARITKPDLIICDWLTPLVNGLEICHQVKSDPELASVYFIFLTAQEEVCSRVEGLNAGADEYVWKPFSMDELQARIRAGLRAQSLTQELKEANQALWQVNQQLVARNELLESLSFTDALTGLLNRRAMDQGLPHLLKQVGSRDTEARYRYLCLLMLDVDHFKRVNDTYGHSKGDAVLQAIAGRLQTNSRPGGMLYRYGGEEFVCIVPGLNPQASIEYGQFLCNAIAKHPIRVANDLLIPVTVSIGGAIMSENNLVDSEELLYQADAALYQAKHEGRNCVRMFSTVEL